MGIRRAVAAPAAIFAAIFAAIAFTAFATQEDEAARWDKIFGAKQPRYRVEPNEFLGRMLARLETEHWLGGKRALDVAMGDGRNALRLASAGFEVTGIDISPVALDKARESAKAKGLALDARAADVATFDYGVDAWDLVSVIYFNPVLDVAAKLKAGVKPGGVIVIEGQGSEHTGGGPPPRTRFAPNSLLQTFKDWRILHYEDGRFESDWNLGPPTHVVRLMARKPEANAPPPGK